LILLQAKKAVGVAAEHRQSARPAERHDEQDAYITTAIINGRKPPQLTAQTLMRLTPRLPAGWAEQRKLLGFA
jgi:hypothetical protein